MKKSNLVIVVISVFLLVGYFGFNEYIKQQQSKEIEAQINSYETYIIENSGATGVERVENRLTYYDNYSNEDSLVEENVRNYIEEDINKALFNSIKDYNSSATATELIELASDYDFITSSNITALEKSLESALAFEHRVRNMSDSEVQSFIKKKKEKIELGFSEDDVKNALGIPKSVMKSTSSLGETVSYTYDNKIIYFHDGKVKNVVEY